MTDYAKEKEEMNKNAQPFHAFVLMKEANGIPSDFEKNFLEQWGITLDAGDDDREEKSDADVGRMMNWGESSKILGCR